MQWNEQILSVPVDVLINVSTHVPITALRIEDLNIFIISESSLVTSSSQFPLPIDNHCSHTYHHRLLSFFLEFHLNGIIQYVVFGGWLISPNIFFDIHPCCCVYQ